MNHFAAIFLVGPYEALKRGPKPGRRKVETPEDRQCKHCGKMYITSAVRRRHEMIHLNIKPFHCIYCPKKFNRNDTCKMHIKSHEKPMSFQCLKCKGDFAVNIRETVGNRVNRRSTGESGKHRDCKTCGKMFINPAVRRRHEKIHLGTKPFQCIYCSKSFGRNDNCNMHIKSHEKPMSFQCLKCKALFVNSDLLKEHVAVCVPRQFHQT
ncbi:putative zinc finger protein [Apostichopus japonicus]|uniref:Putative zinc finger protein n=1 Tax=Stichopus japonicus TaxID=307972 RepID=A0A2G8L941_STIJA|nr:putative zinc finger protein [Apostichopus japonicus]